MQHREQDPKQKFRKGFYLKDPFWWAVGGIAFMALALVFLLLVAQ